MKTSAIRAMAAAAMLSAAAVNSAGASVNAKEEQMTMAAENTATAMFFPTMFPYCFPGYIPFCLYFHTEEVAPENTAILYGFWRWFTSSNEAGEQNQEVAIDWLHWLDLLV